MRANLRFSTLAVLVVAGCNRPDADLFGADPGNTDGVGGVPSTAGGTGNAAGGTAGSTAANGGAQTSVGGAEPGVAGTAPSAGGSGAAGNSNPPDDSGGVNAAGGAGGQPETEPPTAPVCGNGILEAGEECDDSGHTGRDGCDACKVECSQLDTSAVESSDHHCYVGYDAADFKGAQEACVGRGAYLATISSAEENKVVRGLVNNSKWIGGFEDVSPNTKGAGAYVWSNGEPFTYTNWAQGEPDLAKVRCDGAMGGYNGGPSGGPAQTSCYEHCISIQGDGTWIDARCEVSDGYVCEWPPAGTR